MTKLLIKLSVAETVLTKTKDIKFDAMSASPTEKSLEIPKNEKYHQIKYKEELNELIEKLNLL